MLRTKINLRDIMDEDNVKSECPIELAMQLINKKWVIQLIRDMFFGKTRFNEFKEDKPNLSNRILSNCLKEMESNGLIIRNQISENNVEYTLSEKGQSLNKVLYELAMFTLDNDLHNKYYSDERKEELRSIFKNALL